MAFKNPAVNPLTDSQDKLLAQLGSVKNILTLPFKKHQSIPEEKQISALDFMIRIAEITMGAAFIDIMLKKFIDDVFDTQTDKLEAAIILGLAKSLEKQNKHISRNPAESNLQWLSDHALPPLHTAMKIVKALLVKQIIAMIFGPKTKMTHNITTAANNGVLVDPSIVPSDTEMIEIVLAADSMFSTSTADSNEYGDQEYNLVTLRERLEKGQMVFTISCQDVKISLPNNFDTEADKIINNIISMAGQTSAPGQVPNPSSIFYFINNHVGNETQRINTQENKNAIKKTFLQILVDKILNLIIPALTPFLVETFNKINTENPALNLSIIGMVGTPKVLKDLSKSDPGEFDSRKEFTAIVINALYALLLSIVLKKLIKEVKKLIAGALAKKIATRAASKYKRLATIGASLHDAAEKIEKSKNAAKALSIFELIFNYSKHK